MAKQPKILTDACPACEHSVFDPIWGEWKCKVLQHRIHHPVATDECMYYEKSTTEKVIVEDEEE